MHMLLIVFGALLLLFGGGCTLIFVVSTAMDPRSMMVDMSMLWSILVPLGILPAIGGYFMLRAGLRIDRARRAARTAAPPPSEAS